MLNCWNVSLPARCLRYARNTFSKITGNSVALTPVLYMLCFGALATLLDPRLWPAAIFQVPTALLAAAAPDYLYEIVGVGGAASVGFLALRWAERNPAPRTPSVAQQDA